MNAQRMSVAMMRDNARFLTDRMAYTLGIRDPYLIDEIYRINYDYIWGVNDYLDEVAMGYYYDDYMAVCTARDLALRNLLGLAVWNRIVGYGHFHRPIVFADRRWRFSVYDYDRYGRNRYYFHAPRPLNTYAGGRMFRGMAPRHNAPAPAPRREFHNGNGHNYGGQRGEIRRGEMPRTETPRKDVPRSEAPRGGMRDNAPQRNQREGASRGDEMRNWNNRNSSSRYNGTRPQSRTASPTNVSMPSRSNAGAAGGRPSGGRR